MVLVPPVAAQPLQTTAEPVAAAAGEGDGAAVVERGGGARGLARIGVADTAHIGRNGSSASSRPRWRSRCTGSRVKVAVTLLSLSRLEKVQVAVVVPPAAAQPVRSVEPVTAVAVRVTRCRGRAGWCCWWPGPDRRS